MNFSGTVSSKEKEEGYVQPFAELSKVMVPVRKLTLKIHQKKAIIAGLEDFERTKRIMLERFKLDGKRSYISMSNLKSYDENSFKAEEYIYYTAWHHRFSYDKERYDKSRLKKGWYLVGRFKQDETVELYDAPFKDALKTAIRKYGKELDELEDMLACAVDDLPDFLKPYLEQGE